MRATISFEIDLDQVEPTMKVLAAQEADTLRGIASMIEGPPDSQDDLREQLTSALGSLLAVGKQLEQYRDMILSFQKAKMETLLPQPAPEVIPQTSTNPSDFQNVANPMEALAKFGEFMARMPGENVEDEGGSAEEG